jgi:hypothetical protein
LKLDPYGSVFIVFRKTGEPVSDKMETNYPEPEILADFTKPWEVSFDAAMRGPEQPVEITSLEDWSKSTNEKIRYYSGTAVYKNTVVLSEIPSNETLYLNLGKVGNMAEVKVNGQPAGGTWTAPWHVNITNLVKPGENTIEIDVVNNWVNRLIGDSRLPEKVRKTWMNVNPTKPADPLQPSGLMGPVSIVSVRY